MAPFGHVERDGAHADREIPERLRRDQLLVVAARAVGALDAPDEALSKLADAPAITVAPPDVRPAG